MRLNGFAVAVLAGFLACNSAHAANQGVVFGGFYCPTKLACDPNDAGFPTAQQLASATSACVTRNTGTAATADGFFDADIGLDSNKCLSTNAAAFPMTTGGRIVPHCCVTQAPGGSCAIYCSVNSQ